MKKFLFPMGSLLLSLSIFVIFSCPQPQITTTSTTIDPGVESVIMTDQTTYYNIVMDYTTGVNSLQMGVQLGQKIIETIPDIEIIMDSYIEDVITYYAAAAGASGFEQMLYGGMVDRVADFKPQMQQEYCDELDGISTALSGGTTNAMGDDKISIDELYMLNLIPDLGRITQCSGISVFGDTSATGKPITARLLDWYSGDDNQIGKIQAVTTIKKSTNTVVLIGTVGFMGVLSGFNDSNVFAAILDSPTNEAYVSSGRRSYPMDIRHALENYSTLVDVGNFMTDASRLYAYGHLILLSDATDSRVLENDLPRNRALRSWDSNLQGSVEWDFQNAVAAVNSFVLDGNETTNHQNPANLNRWATLTSELYDATGDISPGGIKVTLEEIKSIASFDNGDGPGSQSDGDIYNSGTQQIIIFQPETTTLEIFFKPKSGILPADPTFETVPVSF